MKQFIMDKVFNRMDRAVIHGSTFSKNNMAMAAGLATIQVIEENNLLDNAAHLGEAIVRELNSLIGQYEFLKEVRGKGLMIAIEFGAPKSFSLKTAWNLLETANKGLFCQMVTIPLFAHHGILTQVAGHGMNVVKILAPLVITEKDKDLIVRSFDSVIADCHKVPGSIWDLGKTLAGHALKSGKS